MTTPEPEGGEKMETVESEIVQEHVLDAIRDEREHQKQKWGDRTIPGNGRTAPEWATILTEEVGELSEAALEKHFGAGSTGAIHAEAIQVAAVAVAVAEACERAAIRGRGSRPDDPT